MDELDEVIGLASYFKTVTMIPRSKAIKKSAVYRAHSDRLAELVVAKNERRDVR